MHQRMRELNHQRGQLVDQAHAIMVRGGRRSPAENAKLDRLLAEETKLAGEVRLIERTMAAEASLNDRFAIRAGREDKSVDQVRAEDARASAAFLAYLRHGAAGLSDDQREALSPLRPSADQIQAAQSTTTGSDGGYLVPQSFANRLEEAMKAHGGMFEVSEPLPTDTGAAIPYPTVNDTGNKGARVAENTQITQQDVAFGQVTLDAYLYTSKIVLVPWSLLQDSAFDLGFKLPQWLGTRIARIVNEECTTGTGSSQPNGIVTASTLGKTGPSGQTSTVTYDDFVDMEHSVDSSYREGGRFMFHDDVLKIAKKLTDDNGRPIWVPGLASGAPDTILARGYVINQDMASPAASAKSMLFGALQKYLLRQVRGVQVLRLNERYADYLQVGFMAFARFDGDLLDAGTHPVKYFAHPAS